MREVFVIGDSISIQYGPYLRTLLEGSLKYDRKRGEDQALVNLDKPVGANGGDSSRVLAYIKEQQAQGRKWDILLINCGLHDIKTDPASAEKQVPLEAYRSNLEAIADISMQMSNQLVWVRTTDALEHIHNSKSRSFHRFHEDVAAYNRTADELMAKRGIPSIDLYSFSQKFGEEAFCDHVHYSEDVRKLQAAYIAGYLQAKFASVQ
jgi:lysophospholipase L1-like esterase